MTRQIPILHPAGVGEEHLLLMWTGDHSIATNTIERSQFYMERRNHSLRAT